MLAPLIVRGWDVEVGGKRWVWLEKGWDNWVVEEGSGSDVERGSDVVWWVW